jgi:hypothetical protein
MFEMMDVFAEFEPAERVKAGARTRSRGKRLGHRPVSADVVERIREQLATGAGILKTDKALGAPARERAMSAVGAPMMPMLRKKTGPHNHRNGFDAPLPFALTLLKLHRGRARGPA